MIASDAGEQCSLSYKNSTSYPEIIPTCVYAVGFNNEFIIAKQHPYEFSKELDKSIIHYYILPMKNGVKRN